MIPFFEGLPIVGLFWSTSLLVIIVRQFRDKLGDFEQTLTKRGLTQYLTHPGCASPVLHSYLRTALVHYPVEQWRA